MNLPGKSLVSRVTRWRRTFAASALGVLFALSLVHPAHAATQLPVGTPPAGTSIGNQASATYMDASGISRSVTSNTVYTVVQQVASLTLAPSGAQTSTPGATVYYPETLTNTGNGTDTFNLTAVNGSGFTMTGIQIFADNGSGQPTGAAIASSGALAAGASFKFIVEATVPATATSGTNNVLNVTATSTFTSSVSAAVTDTTTVTNNGVITLTKAVSASSGVANGTTQYTYTLTYTNTGNTTATAVALTDVLPAGMSYVTGSSTWSVTGATALSDTGGTSGTSPNTVVSSYTTSSNTLVYTINQVTAGQSGTVSFKVTVNTGTKTGVLNNTATDTYVPATGATAVSGTSNTVPFTVNQTAGVTLTGATVPSATPGSTVSFANVVTNTGNGTDTFNVAINANTFPAGTTFTLYKSDDKTPLTDTNGDGIPDTGPLAAGASYTVYVQAQLPANATTGGPFTLTKTATSTFNTGVSAPTTDTLTAVTGASVDLTNGTAPYTYGSGVPGYGAGVAGNADPAINPGSTATIPVYVNNTGPVADTYALTTTSTLPTGWTVVFKVDGGSGNCSTTGATITSTASILAGGNELVCAVITVAATGTGAVAGSTSLTFRGASSASGASDSIADAVTVNAVRSITITPNNTGQTYPGGVVVYSHTLTNTGNVAEGNGSLSTITLPTSNSQSGWTSVLYVDINNTGVIASNDPVITAGLSAADTALAANGLLPGQSITILDKVTAPSGATIGTVNTTTITVTTANGTYTTTVPVAALASDGTTIIAGNLQLTKAQAPDANCTGPTGATVYSAANISVLPGGCVIYQITVTNVGSASATSVVVSDATPTYTMLSSAALSAPALTVGGIAVTAAGTFTNRPAAGGTGPVTATVGTLAPGQSAVLTFGVQIQ